jgi:hypothetical protein
MATTQYRVALSSALLLALSISGWGIGADTTKAYTQPVVPFSKSKVEREQRPGLRDLVTTYFTGEVIVSGKYKQLKQDPTGHQSTQLCFDPSPESSRLLPREGSDRYKWFCFNNQEEAQKLLQIPERLLTDGAICAYGGEATVQISDYRIYSSLSGIDSAKLDKVLAVAAPKATTCEEFNKRFKW